MAEKPVETPVEAAKKKPADTAQTKEASSSANTASSNSHFSQMEHALLAATDRSQSVQDREKEVTQRFYDLGLGRGVDASRNKPWLEKASFQVRSVRFHKLMGTEQGGSVEAYEDEVSSIQTLQLELKQSVVVPSNPINIGVDADHSRTTTNSRHVVGRRVHNRTISFRDELDELPFEGGETQPVSPAITQQQEIVLEKEDLTFEEKLAKWVLQRLDRDGEGYGLLHMHVKAIRDGQSPVVHFEEWFQAVDPNEQTEALKQIYQLCHGFVSFFHVTHYVSALELGALEYSAMTEEDYLRQAGAAGSFGLEQVVSAALTSKGSFSRSSHKTRKHSQVKRVGLIRNPAGEELEYYVPRGTYAEAVIGVEVKPIQNLVGHKFLRRVLTHAVAYYIEQQRDASVSPFLITSASINRETVYFSVNEEDMSLQATPNKKKASKFFVLMTDEGKNVHDFHIAYMGKSEVNKGLHRRLTLASFGYSKYGGTQQQPPHYYLSTPLSVIGSNPGPLYFEMNPKKTNTMFILHSRLRTAAAPAELLGPWVQGREGYFINCHHRKFARDGYLAVQKVIEGGEVQYRPVCMPSHKPSVDCFKIFSLVMPTLEEQPPTVKELKASPHSRRKLVPKVVSQEEEEIEESMEMLQSLQLQYSL